MCAGKSELDIVKDKIVSLEEKTAKLERLLIDNPERQRLAGLEQRLAALDLRLAALQVKENLLLKAEQGKQQRSDACSRCSMRAAMPAHLH